MKVHILFDGAPGPDGCTFVEVETLDGKSVNVGKWVDRGDGQWALELDIKTEKPYPENLREAKRYAEFAYQSSPNADFAVMLAQANALIAIAEMQEQQR